MKEDLKHFFSLSYHFATSGFKLRNEGSILGILWYVLNPILTFGLLYVIFSNNLGKNIENYSLYLFIGIILFNFFQAVTNESTEIIKQNKYLIKSVNFPRASLIFGNVLKFLYSHIFEFIILILFIFILGEKSYNLYFYPIILFFFSIFIFGTALLLSSISIFFTDTRDLWIFLSKLIWFATPIFYELEKGTLIYTINTFNPLYYFIKASRDLIVYNSIPELKIIIFIITFSIFFLLVGYLTFKKLKYKFAERM